MIFQSQLSNGITVIGERMDNTRAAALGVWIGSGSGAEREDQAGLAHLIEHMIFKGTKTRSAVQISEEVDFYGGQMNAFTSKECTCYTIKSTDDKLEKSMEILGDLLTEPLFAADELEKEKGVVIEEINMVEDTPDDLVIDELSGVYFAGSPLGKPILGTAQSVKSYSREALFAFLDEHYVAGNTVIACAGSFDEQKLIEWGEKYFANFRKGGMAQRVPAAQRPKPAASKRDKAIEQMNIAIALPGYPNDDDRYIPLLIANNALGGSMSSRLFRSIREERGLAYAVYSYTSSYVNSGAMVFYAGTTAAQADTVYKLMIEEFKKLKADGLTAEEFQRNQNQIRATYILGSEGAGMRMNSLGKAKVLGLKIRTVDEVVQEIDKADNAAVCRAIADAFDLDCLCASFVGRLDAMPQV